MGYGDNATYTEDDWKHIDRDRYNSVQKPSDKGFNCLECGNKGYKLILEDGYNVMVECNCNAERKVERNIQLGQLDERFKKFSFSTWETDTGLKQLLLDKAKTYIEAFGFGWFYVGGQIGSGKTHIATAILQELMRAGHNGSYYYWSDITTQLKADMNSHEYITMMRDLTSIPVLFIDDFLKTDTNADMNIAFNIVQKRADKQLPTILTSEKYVNEIQDEAISSRIVEHCGGYLINIERDESKNYRLKEE